MRGQGPSRGLQRRPPRSVLLLFAILLAVDQRFLQRVQRRYPRIASKVFLNLTSVLSDRLERTTQTAVGATP